MQKTLTTLRKKWQSRDDIPEAVANLKIRVGINTGNFVTGNMG
ncbi:MAG: hypothetical protein ACLFQB_11325 [Chitinispirillaceae bacterium]